MLALVAAGLVLAAQQPAERPLAPPAAACLPDSRLIRSSAAPKVQKLGELPKARVMLPVLRRVDGCDLATFVSGPIEGNGRFAPPARKTP
ncbi:MAG: hypothetical protein ACK4YQ_02210 [Phenylobacterium sp.]|uniref:hypothetical protein n=1 Tax=Phenylobacterium sp. TaxID=1871053 RepID=UPI00391AB70A